MKTYSTKVIQYCSEDGGHFDRADRAIGLLGKKGWRVVTSYGEEGWIRVVYQKEDTPRPRPPVIKFEEPK